MVMPVRILPPRPFPRIQNSTFLKEGSKGDRLRHSAMTAR